MRVRATQLRIEHGIYSIWQTELDSGFLGCGGRTQTQGSECVFGRDQQASQDRLFGSWEQSSDKQKGESDTAHMLTRKGIANSLAAVAVVVALVIGAFGYFLLSTYGVRTATVTISATYTTTEVSVSTCTLTTGGAPSTTSDILVQAASCISGASNSLTITLEDAGGAPGTITGISPTNLNDNTTISYTVQPFASNAILHFRPPADTLGTGEVVTGSLVVAGGYSVPFTATCS